MKKHFLLLFIMLVSAVSIWAQLGGTHNYLDTAYIAQRNMGQQRDYRNHKQAFPARPRDQFQIGIFGGYAYVDGDVPTAIRGAGTDLGNYAYVFGGHARKAVGYVLSFRGTLSYMNMIGLDYQRNRNYNNHPLLEQLYLPVGRGYIANHRTQAFNGAFEAIISLNNIMFHSKQSRFNLYLVAGYSALYYKTTMDVTTTDGARYPFETLATSTLPRPELRKQLRQMLDGIYETQGTYNDRRPGGNSNYQLRHSFNSGFGIEYRLNSKMSLSGEYKRIQPRDDYLDGYYRQSGDLANPTFTSEWDNIGTMQLGFNYNVGNKKKRISPLWWMNPLEYAYKEMANPQNMIVNIDLKDDDNDGVTNQFDLEKNTPPNAPVDTHGVSKDTDGDGVPDYKDKELITLQKCFPVDVDGVGNCPVDTTNKCCDIIKTELERIKKEGVPTSKDPNGKPIINSGDCQIGFLPSIQFNPNSITLTKEAKAILADIAQKMKDNADCKVAVIGYCKSTKYVEQRSWDRVNVVINYLMEKQAIALDRFIFKYGESGGDCDVIDFEGTSETGNNSIPAPHPKLRRSK
jgi:opacity protein-like surface antigen